MVKKQYTVISLFAGCGGSSLGYKMAGYKELLAVEWDKNAVETLKLNFKGLNIFHGDIKDLTVDECLKITGLKKGELDILDGSPPCQGFSTAGKRQVNDARNDLFKEYVRLIKGLNPKVFVMENVSGMIKGKMKGRYIEIWEELNNIGYNVKSKIMNAMWYDVPQSRDRLIFIGVRKDLNKEPTFPKPKKTFITVGEAIKDCNIGLSDGEFTGKRKDLAEKIKQNKDGSHVIKGTAFNLKRLDNNKPSRTIIKMVGNTNSTFGGGLIHPTEDRHVSINELKRLSTFPDDFIFIGKFKDQWARIGNAVMPKFMYHIAKNIKENILENI